MKQIQSMEIRILWGLPGSGKTTYANNIGQKHHGTVVIDVDSINKYEKANLPRVISEMVLRMGNKNNIVIVDGLFTTNGFVHKLTEQILKDSEKKNLSIEFVVVWWKKDIETCLHNDKGRRKKDSKITIENLPFEIPDQKILTNVKSIIAKDVIAKPESKVFVDEYANATETDYWSKVGRQVLRSGSWCLGGTCNSYDGHTSRVDAEPQPTTFEELDELLMKLCPNITFLQYKHIFSKAVTTMTHEDRDYYGGCKQFAQFQCDLDVLYEKLREFNLIE